MLRYRKLSELVLQRHFLTFAFVVSGAGSNLACLSLRRPVPDVLRQVLGGVRDTVEQTPDVVNCQQDQSKINAAGCPLCVLAVHKQERGGGHGQNGGVPLAP